MSRSSTTARQLGRDGPRLRVVHFLAWMVGCGIVLVGYQQITRDRLQSEFWLFAAVYNVTMAISFGYAVGIVAVLGRGWLQDARRFPSHPGHWLLVFAAVAGLLNAILTVVFEILAASNPRRWFAPYWVQFGMYHSATITGLYHQLIGWGAGAIAGMFFLWSLRGRLAWPWFLVFVLGSLLSAILSAWYGLVWLGAHRQFGNAWFLWAVHLYAVFILVAVFAILTAVLTDVWSRKRRDWLHWTGVAVWLALGAVQLAGFVRIVWLWP